MKALVCLGPSEKEWREVPDPVVQKRQVSSVKTTRGMRNVRA